MSYTTAYSRRPRGITADKLRSDRYELQLTNFLVDTPMLVPKKKAWPSNKKTRRHLATTASPPKLSITLPPETVVVSDKSSSADTHFSSDADSESEMKETSPSLKKAKNVGTIKAKKHDKCMKDDVPCLKKKKQVAFDDTDTGFMADTSEPELPLKSCLKNKGKNGKMAAVQSDASEEKSSAPETTEPSSTDADSTKAVVLLSDEGSNVGPTISDADNKSNATISTSDNWSPSDDAAILSMKEGGESWAAIGLAIGRGKKETQKRCKELSALLKQQTGSDSAAAGSTTDNMTVTTVPDTENDADNEMTDGTAKKGKGNGKGGKKTSSHTGMKKQNNKKPSPTAQNALVTISSDSDDEAGGTTSDNEVDSEAEVYTRMYSNMYPSRNGGAELEPDSDFDVLECSVLEVIDTKNKVNRWLEVQAEFFNATGRMVPVGVLRRKLEGGPKMVAIVEADEE